MQLDPFVLAGILFFFMQYRHYSVGHKIEVVVIAILLEVSPHKESCTLLYIVREHLLEHGFFEILGFFICIVRAKELD